MHESRSDLRSSYSLFSIVVRVKEMTCTGVNYYATLRKFCTLYIACMLGHPHSHVLPPTTPGGRTEIWLGGAGVRPTIHTKHPHAKVKIWGGPSRSGSVALPLRTPPSWNRNMIGGGLAMYTSFLVRNDPVNKTEFLTKWINGIGVMYIALCLYTTVRNFFFILLKEKTSLCTSISQHLLLSGFWSIIEWVLIYVAPMAYSQLW